MFRNYIKKFPIIKSIIAIIIPQIPIFIWIESALLKGISLGFILGFIICLTLFNNLLKKDDLE